MKTPPAITQRVQKIKGTAYVYEDYPYWDSEKKQTRHKRVYIGKKDENGRFIPNKRYLARSQPAGGPEPAVAEKPAERRFGGVSYLLDQIAARSMVADDLRACFPKDHKIIQSLAYYLVCESDSPMYRFSHWARTHAHPYGRELASQRISEVFGRINYDGIMRFLSRQRKRYEETEHLVYDTTSISSYSELLRQVRYGNNKSGEPLPQINLALVFGQSSMMPVYYRSLPGNLTDVTTLRKLLQDLDQMEMGKIKLVLDRGFYSARNIDALYKHRCKFVVGARRNTRFIKGHLGENRPALTDFTSYDVELGLHYHSVTSHWPYKDYDHEGRVVSHGQRRIYVHMYYNSAKAEADKTAFFTQLANARQAVLQGGGSEQQQALVDTYLHVHTTPVRGTKITINDEAIRQHTAEFGYFVLLSNDIKDPAQALWVYRNKDVVEKAFGNLKNRLNMRRPHVSSEESLEGKLFVQFVALIFVSWIHKGMKEKKLYQNRTMQQLLDELDCIERYQQEGKRTNYGEVTSKQRAIYEHFGMTPPDML
jgi:transposase